MERQWPQDAATVVERAVTAQLRSATGDGSFSHGRDMGRATVTVSRRGKGARVEAGGSQRVWGILQKGTKAHTVDAGPGKALRTPRGPRRRVSVSGVRPRKSWDKGVQAAAPAVNASTARAVHQVVG